MRPWSNGVESLVYGGPELVESQAIMEIADHAAGFSVFIPGMVPPDTYKINA